MYPPELDDPRNLTQVEEARMYYNAEQNLKDWLEDARKSGDERKARHIEDEMYRLDHSHFQVNMQYYQDQRNEQMDRYALRHWRNVPKDERLPSREELEAERQAQRQGLPPPPPPPPAPPPPPRLRGYAERQALQRFGDRLAREETELLAIELVRTDPGGQRGRDEAQARAEEAQARADAQEQAIAEERAIAQVEAMPPAERRRKEREDMLTRVRARNAERQRLREEEAAVQFTIPQDYRDWNDHVQDRQRWAEEKLNSD
jgi:pyruvate/2-oxoglutarate dehydrogenase complex dihydrolipoamide acyltransferase (E2) component